MKFFTLPALLAAALLSALAAIPFLPAAKPVPMPFALELRAGAPAGGVVRIYYDVGRGYNATDTAECAFGAGGPHACRLALPAGDFRSIRLDPIDGAGTATLGGPVHIVSPSGRVVRTLAWAELRSRQQIASRRETPAGLEIATTAAADDPQLEIAFSPPLRLEPGWPEKLAGFWPRTLAVFATLAALLFVLERATRLRTTLARAAGSLAARPGTALAGIAALAVLISAYPVVFLGKSHVTPNFGTTLLYESFPTVPGYASDVVADAHGSDVAALMFQHVPYALMERRALAEGGLPWWNRHTLAGAPLLGQGQSMFGDPLHFAVLLCNGAAWAWDVKFLVVKWLFAVGLGLVVLRVAPASLPAPSGNAGGTPALLPALLVAAAAPFIGFFHYRINHPAFFSLGYAPWVLLGWLGVAQATSSRRALRWALALTLANVALLNSGTVKEACVLALTLNLTGLLVTLTRAPAARERLARTALGALGAATALLLSAPAWATFLATMRAAYTISGHAAADQLPPWLMLGAFDELFFRPLTKSHAVLDPALNVFLLLGLLYFLATLREHLRSRPVLILTAVTLATMAVVFGVVPPAWITRVPLLGNIGHVDNCGLCVLLVLWPVLAGVGFAAAARRLRGPEGRGDLVVVAVLGAALVGAWLGGAQAAVRVPPLEGGATIAPATGDFSTGGFIGGSLLALSLASVVLCAVARRAGARGTFSPAGALLALACGAVLLWRHALHAPAVGFENYVVQPPARVPFGGVSPAMEFLRAAQSPEPGRVFGMHGNLTPAWNAVYGLEAIHGADALQGRWLRELIDVSPVKWNSSWRIYVAARDAAAARPFFDVLNVRHYVDLPTNPPLEDASLTRVQRADLDVYASRTAWPRAFFTDRLLVYENPPELMRAMLAAEGRALAAIPRTAAENPTFARVARENETRTIAPATDYRLRANATEFRVRASGPGVIVLTEAWWPGVARAEVNGRAADVHRVNHAFQGIVVEQAGDYRVSVRYRAPHAGRDVALMWIGAGLFVAGGVVAGRRKAKRTP